MATSDHPPSILELAEDLERYQWWDHDPPDTEADCNKCAARTITLDLHGNRIIAALHRMIHLERVLDEAHIALQAACIPLGAAENRIPNSVATIRMVRDALKEVIDGRDNP